MRMTIMEVRPRNRHDSNAAGSQYPFVLMPDSTGARIVLCTGGALERWGDETNSARVIPGPRIGTLVNPQQQQDTRRAFAQVCRRHSGALAIEALRATRAQACVALVNGCFTSVDVSSPLKARKQVDVARDYNRENCRPRLSALAGRSTFGL
jgi:hypothetical protein